MDMARAILERVQEVELEITPEFQKREDRVVTVREMNDAFAASGWLLRGHEQKGGVVTYTYGHSKIPGALMSYTHSSHLGKVVGQMMVKSGGDFEPLRFDPEPYMVEKLTKDWLAIEAEETAKGKLPDVVAVIDMITQLDWVTTSDIMFFGGGGHKARVFQHPKVEKKIRVTYSPKTGAIVSAMVLYHDETIVKSIVPSSPANIYKEAQELMKEAGA